MVITKKEESLENFILVIDRVVYEWPNIQGAGAQESLFYLSISIELWEGEI